MQRSGIKQMYGLPIMSHGEKTSSRRYKVLRLCAVCWLHVHSVFLKHLMWNINTFGIDWKWVSAIEYCIYRNGMNFQFKYTIYFPLIIVLQNAFQKVPHSNSNHKCCTGFPHHSQWGKIHHSIHLVECMRLDQATLNPLNNNNKKTSPRPFDNLKKLFTIHPRHLICFCYGERN